jgi:hypothetical protein
MKRALRRIWARLRGKVLVSDHVVVTMNVSAPAGKPLAFDIERVIRKELANERRVR